MVIAPEPRPDDSALSHDASGVADQGQLSWVTTDATTVPPGMQGLKSTGLTEYRHVETSPACLTVKVRSATTIVVLLSPICVLRATVYETVPLPDP